MPDWTIEVHLGPITDNKLVGVSQSSDSVHTGTQPTTVGPSEIFFLLHLRCLV